MSNAVSAMSALAHESRLDLIRRLIKAGPAGLAVGQLVDACGLNFSTVSAQLLVLANAELVTKNRRGRSIIYSANYASMQSLIAFLMHDCCQGNRDIVEPFAATSDRATDCSTSRGTAS